MRYLICTLSTCLIFNISRAQISLKDKELINAAINRKGVFYYDTAGNNPDMLRQALKTTKNNSFYIYSRDSVLYTDHAGYAKVVDMSSTRSVSDRQERARYTRIKKDSLVLSEPEVNYVLAEMEKAKYYVWSDGLLPDSKALNADAVRNKTWDERAKMGIKVILSIYKPVFIRNDSICFFYYAEYCGPECAGGHFNVYKKIDGYWVFWMELLGWSV